MKLKCRKLSIGMSLCSRKGTSKIKDHSQNSQSYARLLFSYNRKQSLKNLNLPQRMTIFVRSDTVYKEPNSSALEMKSDFDRMKSKICQCSLIIHKISLENLTTNIVKRPKCMSQNSGKKISKQPNSEKRCREQLSRLIPISSIKRLLRRCMDYNQRHLNRPKPFWR